MKTRIINLFLLPALIAVLGLMPAIRVMAQTFATLHSFAYSDGRYPFAGLVLSGNTLYGTAYQGGSSEVGTVFAINRNGTGFTNLHSFPPNYYDTSQYYTNSGGLGPIAGLVLSDDTLYGTASGGGYGTLGDDGGSGTVFAVKTDGTAFTTLHIFGVLSRSSPHTNDDGAYPGAGLILSGSTLYGTAQQGGSSGYGTVFAINTNGTGFTNLHTFSGDNDGAYPIAGLIISGDTLYGTAAGGGSSGNGTVFAVHTDGTGFTNLHSFNDYSDGSYPRAGLILSGNTLYGAAAGGGSSGNGTVFAINTNGTGFTNLHSFTAFSGDPFHINSDGANPVAGLLLSGNTLYGTARIGGSSGNGTVFAVHTDGTGFTALHTFAGDSEGANPRAGLILSGNILYGTASDDWNWSTQHGTVFSLSFRPQLTITPSGPNVILSWPTNVAGFDYTGYTLQFTTNFASQAFWVPVSPAPVVLNGQNTVTNSISGNRRFYRLIRSAPQTWATVADMPSGRDSLGAATGADGRIYAIGGLDAAGPLDTVEAYTPGTPGSWATKASMPTPRYGHAVTVGVDGRIYAIGGLAVPGILATLEVYTPSTDSWATKASMPTARCWLGAAAAADGRIYAIGGADDSGPLATVEVYTPSSDSWATATSMPTARFSFAAATTADRLITYAIGGNGTGGFLKTVEVFTPNAGAGTWATRASTHVYRNALAAAAGVDGRIYAMGGDGGAFNLATVEAYTPSTDSWVIVPSMLNRRSYLAAAAGADGRIYAIGGQDGANAVGAKVEVYTP